MAPQDSFIDDDEECWYATFPYESCVDHHLPYGDSSKFGTDNYT